MTSAEQDMLLTLCRHWDACVERALDQTRPHAPTSSSSFPRWFDLAGIRFVCEVDLVAERVRIITCGRLA